MSHAPVKLSDGKEILLSPGKHNEVQAAIVVEFASHFAIVSILFSFFQYCTVSWFNPTVNFFFFQAYRIFRIFGGKIFQTQFFVLKTFEI